MSSSSCPPPHAEPQPTYDGAISVGAPTGRRVWLYRLFMVGCVVVGSFVLTEAGFRVRRSVVETRLEAKAERGETWAIYDEDLGYRIRPAPDRPLGLRSPPIGAKSPDSPRVLILGDSIPYGGNSVDDTLVAHAQRELDDGGFKAELINAGIPGYTTYQELDFLKKYGLALQPDVVGLCFCVNDLHEVLQVFRVRNGKIIGNVFDTGESAAAKSHGGLYMLARKSLFLRWLRHRAQDVGQRLDIEVTSGYSFDSRSDLATAWQDEPWKDFERWMREFVSLGHEHRFRVFVVAFPYAAQYRAEYLKRDRAYVLKPQTNLARICRTLGVPLLDLYDTVTPVSDLQADGIHLTSSGRRRIGSQLAAFLKQGDLLR